MAATKIRLAYSTITGRLRGWTVPDDDSELNTPLAKAGISYLTLTNAAFTQAQASGDPISSLQALVNAHTKSAPSGDRYALVPNALGATPTTVAGWTYADPALDEMRIVAANAVTPITLIAHATADQGWTYTPGPNAQTPGTFTAPVVVNGTPKGGVV